MGGARPPAGSVAEVAENLFRHEAGKLVATLTRIFGLDRLHLAEDVVQEALIRALSTWPYHGVPDNPSAWITQTAKNLALDVIRERFGTAAITRGVLLGRDQGWSVPMLPD